MIRYIVDSIEICWNEVSLSQFGNIIIWMELAALGLLGRWDVIKALSLVRDVVGVSSVIELGSDFMFLLILC